MQNFQLPANLAEQIKTLNAKIGEESPERVIRIRSEFRPFGHNGRVLNVPFYDVVAEGSGKFSITAQAAKNTILPVINEQIVTAARQAINAQIAAEEEARKEEAAAFASRLGEANQRAEEEKRQALAQARIEAQAQLDAAEAARQALEAQLAEQARQAKEAAEAAEKEAEGLRAKQAAEAAEKQAALEAQLKALADAKAGRYNKASRGMAGFSMVLLALVCIVGTAMNCHNVRVLYGQIFHWSIIFLFAFILAFIPLIFAWVNDKDKVKQSTWILPVDYIVTVVLFILCNTDSQLVKSWGWLAENVNNVLLVASLIGVGFYAYQTYLIYNKLLNIVSNEKYKAFFMSLFD